MLVNKIKKIKRRFTSKSKQLGTTKISSSKSPKPPKSSLFLKRLKNRLFGNINAKKEC